MRKLSFDEQAISDQLERRTGKSTKDWNRIYHERRAKGLRSGRISASRIMSEAVFAAESDYFGFIADDVVIGDWFTTSEIKMVELNYEPPKYNPLLDSEKKKDQRAWRYRYTVEAITEMKKRYGILEMEVFS